MCANSRNRGESSYRGWFRVNTIWLLNAIPPTTQENKPWVMLFERHTAPTNWANSPDFILPAACLQAARLVKTVYYIHSQKRSQFQLQHRHKFPDSNILHLFQDKQQTSRASLQTCMHVVGNKHRKAGKNFFRTFRSQQQERYNFVWIELALRTSALHRKWKGKQHLVAIMEISC